MNSTDLKISQTLAAEPVLPAPGKVVSIPFSVTAVNPSGANTISVQVVHGDFCVTRTLCMESVFAKDDLSITKATIGRWKHGCSGAFEWHDMGLNQVGLIAGVALTSMVRVLWGRCFVRGELTSDF